MNIFYILSREYYIMWLISVVIAIPAALWGYNKMPGANKLPPQSWIFVLGAGIILVIIFLTTSYHTTKAAMKNPVEALRYE